MTLAQRLRGVPRKCSSYVVWENEKGQIWGLLFLCNGIDYFIDFTLQYS